MEFGVILEARKSRQKVTADMVEAVIANSDNQVFQTTEFRSVLGDFRKYKCHTPNVGKLNVGWECDAIRKRLGL